MLTHRPINKTEFFNMNQPICGEKFMKIDEADFKEFFKNTVKRENEDEKVFTPKKSYRYFRLSSDILYILSSRNSQIFKIMPIEKYKVNPNSIINHFLVKYKVSLIFN